MYTLVTLNRPPHYLRPENLATKSNDAAVWFYRSASTFSNHSVRAFKEDGISYNCSEQYLMSHKADLFHSEGPNAPFTLDED